MRVEKENLGNSRHDIAADGFSITTSRLGIRRPFAKGAGVRL
jgi:hypothetical protein